MPPAPGWSGLLDNSLEDSSERVTWRRRQVMDGRTGALDLPGSTWRDRAAIDRGDGVFLAGDMVAAPGLLSEVAWASGVEAARGALRHAAAGSLAFRNLNEAGSPLAEIGRSLGFVASRQPRHHRPGLRR